MSYHLRVEYGEHKLVATILDLRRTLCDIERQRFQPLQDDWDDALHIAYYQLDEAILHAERALEALREGT